MRSSHPSRVRSLAIGLALFLSAGLNGCGAPDRDSSADGQSGGRPGARAGDSSPIIPMDSGVLPPVVVPVVPQDPGPVTPPPAVQPGEAPPLLTFTGYHDQNAIKTYLRELARTLPNLVQFNVLGQSKQGREIAYVVLAAGSAEGRKAIYINGTHHGDEWTGTESALGVIDYFVRNREQPAVAALLTRYAIYVQPLVNPDGQAANRREDSMGRDPNRDYSYPNRPDAQSFKVQEIALVKSLHERVAFRGALAYHAGMEAVLWSWCYTGSQVDASDYNLLYTLSKKMALAMGFSKYVQSYNDYSTEGEYIDYAYMKNKTMALTVEVSDDGEPSGSALGPIVQNAIKGTVTYLEALAAADGGWLAIEQEDVQHFGPEGPAHLTYAERRE